MQCNIWFQEALRQIQRKLTGIPISVDGLGKRCQKWLAVAFLATIFSFNSLLMFLACNMLFNLKHLLHRYAWIAQQTEKNLSVTTELRRIYLHYSIEQFRQRLFMSRHFVILTIEYTCSLIESLVLTEESVIFSNFTKAHNTVIARQRINTISFLAMVKIWPSNHQINNRSHCFHYESFSSCKQCVRLYAIEEEYTPQIKINLLYIVSRTVFFKHSLEYSSFVVPRLARRELKKCQMRTVSTFC